MARRALYLLLALTLILNGISAPWAMAHTSHDTQAAASEHAGHPRHAPTSASTPTASMAHHAHHADPASGDATATTRSDAHDDSGRCCDGALCQCGCMLPPVMLLAGMPGLRVTIDHPTLIAPAAHLAPHDESPPLRPPAV